MVVLKVIQRRVGPRQAKHLGHEEAERFGNDVEQPPLRLLLPDSQLALALRRIDDVSALEHQAQVLQHHPRLPAPRRVVGIELDLPVSVVFEELTEALEKRGELLQRARAPQLAPVQLSQRPAQP